MDAGGRQRVDDGQAEGVDPNSSTLISRLESEVAFLREQVHRQQEIIAQQALTMRQLTAAPSQESPEDAETVEGVVEPMSYGVEVPESTQEATEAAEASDEQQGRGRPHPDALGAQGPQRRPWWRTMLGR